MAMIRRAELNDMIHAPVAMDLEDLRRRAAGIREAAVAEAQRLVAEAKAERDRLVAGARERGHAEGLAKGMTEGRAKGEAEAGGKALEEHRERLEALSASWEAALAEFERRREEMLAEARDDVLALALAIARKVTHRAVLCDPGVVVEQVSHVLAMQARPTALTVAVHPDDESAVRAALPSVAGSLGGGAHARLELDGTLARGSCVVRTEGGGTIDAGIDLQLDRIVADLLPAREGAAGGGGEGAAA